MILTNFNFPRIFFAGIIAFREKMVYNSMYKISCKGNQKWKLYIPTF